MKDWAVRSLGIACIMAIAEVAACGGSTSSGAGQGPVTQSEFPNAFAQAVCTNMGSCCSTAGLPFNLTTCEERMAAAYQSEAQSHGVLPSSYDEQASGTCLTAAAAAARQCNLDAVVGSQGACGPFFYPPEVHGKLGDPCDGSCRYEGTGETCTGIGVAPDGGDLSPVRCFASDGVFCGDKGLCEQLAAVGQSCATISCDINGFCNDSAVCEALRPEGGDCNYAYQCASGLYCPAAYSVVTCPPQGGQCTGTSGPPYCTKLKANGASCMDDTECTIGWCSNGVCGGPSGKLVSFLCVL